ncbi:MAG TPA: phosphate/phosphite/phosphonate ABC transporter substrate-binding protein [Gammaproteobacteria bacterium]|nr:phosphate/phosphite/phosphonate ABC transporter substrate-binding protein [Gammaproteobacteria bacterium]
MNNKHITALPFTIFVLIFFILCSAPKTALSNHLDKNLKDAHLKPFVVGIFPRRNKSVTRRLFNPLIRYLETKLNHRVILKTPATFSIFWEDVEDGKYDLVHFNQYHYIISKKNLGYTAILRNKEFGKDTLSSAIIVRKDSGINSVDDLKGKTIVFGGGPKAMQSYIYSRYLLKHSGLVAGNYIEDFSINPPNALFALYYKKADAAGVGDTTIKLDMVSKQIDTNKLKVLLRGVELPHLPWAIKDDVPLKLRQLIQNTLASLHKTSQGKEILKAAGLDQLIPSKDNDYDKHRKIVEDVLGEAY